LQLSLDRWYLCSLFASENRIRFFYERGFWNELLEDNEKKKDQSPRGKPMEKRFRDERH
jgi:hypothetical protein